MSFLHISRKCTTFLWHILLDLEACGSTCALLVSVHNLSCNELPRGCFSFVPDETWGLVREVTDHKVSMLLGVCSPSCHISPLMLKAACRNDSWMSKLIYIGVGIQICLESSISWSHLYMTSRWFYMIAREPKQHRMHTVCPEMIFGEQADNTTVMMEKIMQQFP